MKFPVIKKIVKCVLPALLITGTLTVSGQKNNTANINTMSNSGNIEITALIANQTKYIKKLYSDKVEAPKELINGKEYEPYYLRSEVKPLLFPKMERTASILTQTRSYNNLTLQYDTFLDELIYTDTSRTINFRFPQIALNKDIIIGFNLYFDHDSLLFRNLRSPDCEAKMLREGFYEVAYEGVSSYLIKHESSYYQRQGLDNYKYSPKNYISTGGEYHRVKNQKNLLLLFGANSSKVRNYIHATGIRMRKADKAQIVSILKFYDSLVKAE